MLRSYLILILTLTASYSWVDAQVVINEFLASNTWTNVDGRDYWDYSDWIEIYNSGTESVDLTNYSIADDINGSSRYYFGDGIELAAGEYLIVWADGNDKQPGNRDTLRLNIDIPRLIRDHHTDFKLSTEGESLALYDSSGQVIDSITFGKQLADVSYGRKSDDINSWAWFGTPTPAASNETINSETVQFASEVNMIPEGAVYIGSQTITFTSAAGESIRYTTDGSMPDESSTMYSAPIPVTSPTVLKARAFSNNKLAGQVNTQSYLINSPSSLPSISVSADPQDLFGLGYGIYLNGYKEREIPTTVEYLDEGGVRKFEVGAGAELFGSNIFLLGQKPISLTMKNKYGDDFIQYPLFEERGEVIYDDFVLRNGGNDNGLTFFRDALVMSFLMGELDIDYQAYQPCAVYLNGDYWGLYNLREKLNDDHLLYTKDIDPLSVDILEDNSDVRTGNDDAWQSFLAFLENNSLADSVNYQYAAAQIDLQNYMDYKILKVFIGYWIDEFNLKFWREQNNGKWRWMAFDLEHSFGQLTSDSCTTNTLQKVSSTGGDLPDWATFVFRKFLENDYFKQTFANRFISHLSTTFTIERLSNIIDELTAYYQPEMGKHINRWSSDPFAIPSIQSWLEGIEEIRTYVECRPEQVYAHLMELLESDQTFQLSLDIPGNDTTVVLVNGVAVPSPIFESAFPASTQLELIVIPQLDWEFSGWNGMPSPDTVEFTLIADTIFTPLFQEKSASVLSDAIHEDMVLDLSGSPYHITDDIVIDSFVTLEVQKGVELLLADKASIIVHGILLVDGRSDMKVILRSDPHPSARRPYYNTEPKWGAIVAKNATGGVGLGHCTLTGSTYGKNRYSEKASISSFRSNIFLSGVDIPSSIQPFYSEYGNITIRNSRLRTMLTGDLINIKYADYALIDSCDLEGNNAEDMDAIDLDGLMSGIICNNRIYNFTGDNSDGIDLGESVSEVLIERNEIYNCSDKGISIGQQSRAQISDNLIVNCAQGIGIKDEGSIGYLDHNTLFNNTYGVAVFEKTAGEGGGQAVISNTIISKSLGEAVYVDALSEVDVEFSLAESDLPTGEGNLKNDPRFVNASTLDFNLRPNSPCIDTGDPSSPNDQDGSRTDMGARLTYHPVTGHDVVVNEVSYNSGDCSIKDWVELYNHGTANVDLSNWQMQSGLDQFTLPDGTVLIPHGYLVLCRDTVNFNAQFNEVRTIGNFDFGLSNAGAEITLLDSSGNVISSFTYDDRHPWPRGADGYCNSLEIFDPKYDHSVPLFWHASFTPFGTPGRRNSEIPIEQDIHINELMSLNTSYIADENGEFDDWIELFNSGDINVDLGGLYITDDLSNLFKWRILRTNTDTSKVEPLGFELLWADNDPEQGPAHLDFRLSSSGEEIALIQVTATDTIILDSISFGPLTSEITFGQLGDGMGNWQVLSPTPGTTNQIVSVIESISNLNVNLFPNPASNQVHLSVTNVSSDVQSIHLVDMTGKTIKKQDGQQSVLHLDDISPGSYILILEIEGVRLAKKLLVN